LQYSEGILLIAEPFMSDPNFSRSVVVITLIEPWGIEGLILNKPIQQTLGKVLPDFPYHDIPLFYGGPVHTDHLYFLHTIETLKHVSQCIGPNVYAGYDIHALKAHLLLYPEKKQQVKFFLGCSGWNNYQLPEEIEGNSWILGPKIDTRILNEMAPSELWKKILIGMGAGYQEMANFPNDPSLN